MGSPRTKETFYTFEGDGLARLDRAARVVDKGLHPGRLNAGAVYATGSIGTSATRFSMSGGTRLSHLYGATPLTRHC